MTGGRERWTERVAAAMRAAGASLNTWLFYAGGADRFVTDYPLSGAPVMNALFTGARGMYNSTGDFYQEPMELIAAEYSWNVRSDGFHRIPATNEEARALLRDYAYGENKPAEVFGPGGLYERSCRLLYGVAAGKIMAAYYRLSVELPETRLNAQADARPQTYLPLTWDRMYAVPSHWRHLVQDSHTWGKEIHDETFASAVARMKLTRTELHRRLARRWGLLAGMNAKATSLVYDAIKADPRPEAREDLEFLASLLGAYQPLCGALTEYHQALSVKFADGKPGPRLDRAATLAQEAAQLAKARFPEPIDPVGGEVGGLRNFSARLVAAISVMQNGN
jgi:hypothetical protein